MENEPVKKPRKRTDRLAYIDFDGSRINPGKNYRNIKALNKLRHDVLVGACPHPSVMITERCQPCGRVHVYVAQAMSK